MQGNNLALNIQGQKIRYNKKINIPKKFFN